MADFLRSPEARQQFGTEYHIWFYENNIWLETKWCGIQTLKSPSDMWNYQEIISEIRPSLIVETGTYLGGSALFFANILSQNGIDGKVLTVDPNDHGISEKTKSHPMIEMMRVPSIDPSVPVRIKELRAQFPGPMFIILDGDHTAENVFKELWMLKDLTVMGDYLIVEDSNLSGHPVRNYPEGQDKPGPGPYEAVIEYDRRWPDDYVHDTNRELKFGFTFATNGFLIRR
jgi:cephalosporin hydroxylase